MSITDVTLDGVPTKILRGVVVPLLVLGLLFYAFKVPAMERDIETVKAHQERSDDALSEIRMEQLQQSKVLYEALGREQAAEDIKAKINKLAATQAAEKVVQETTEEKK